MTSLKQKLLLIISLLFCLLFIGLFVVINREIVETTLPLNSQATQQLVNSKSQQINDWFSERISEVATLAEFSSRHDLTTDDLFIETKALEQRQFQNYESIRLVTTAGTSKSWIAPNFSIKDRPYYQRLIQSESAYSISNALHSKEGNRNIIIVLYRLPKATSDSIQYIAAAINVEQMEKMAEELQLYDGVGTLVNAPVDSADYQPWPLRSDRLLTFSGHLDLLPEWEISYTVSQGELLQSGLRIQRIALLLAAILFVLLIMFLLVLLNGFIKPLESLTTTISDIQSGNQQARAPITSKDEIGRLSQHFNTMLDQLYLSQQENTKGQIRLLQEQVKPHFLYNTLDTIQWLAVAGDSHGVEQMVTALSDYFRVGLNNGSEMTTLAKEMQHVTSYLTIQEIRYEKQIDLAYDIEGDLQGVIVPHFLLQPLIENALYHGIRPLTTKGQVIKIHAREAQKNIILTVSNNGRLPSEEKLLGIQTFLESDLSQREAVGFGIYSIAYRLKLLYPSRHQLTAEIRNKQFLITITLPKEEQHDHLNY